MLDEFFLCICLFVKKKNKDSFQVIMNYFEWTTCYLFFNSKVIKLSINFLSTNNESQKSKQCDRNVFLWFHNVRLKN